MHGRTSPDAYLDRRLPLYAYLEPIIVGRRILEIGRVREASAEYLLGLGAARVVTAEADLAGIQGPFDLVLVPEAETQVMRAGAVTRWRSLLGAKGRVVVAVANPERAGLPSGVGYYDLHDAVGHHFSRVQMFGVTPFLGVGLVEFEGAVDGLRVDARLVKPGSEAPSIYVAVGGGDAVTGLGYALVQLPWSTLPASGQPTRAPEPQPAAALPDPAVAELRRKLDETAAQSASAMRVARAQGDEIEELRARLKRAAEDRASLDAEIAKLRRGLAEADEAVVTLTRRTTDEMAAIADRLAAGLRGPSEGQVRAALAEVAGAREEADRLRKRLGEAEARATAAEERLSDVGGGARERQAALEDALERLRLAESELGRARRTAARFEEEARTSVAGGRDAEEMTRTLAARDERIARLETEKQDLVWRLAELEDKLRGAIARAVRTEEGRAASGTAASPSPGASSEELAAAREGRERALEGFHQAAAAHIGELTELKASVAEQSALVAELEDALVAAEARAASATAEVAGLKKTAKDLEEADRSRRSRLAELEGKLLRLEHERKAGLANGAPDARVAELESERDGLRRQLEQERAAWAHERQTLRAQLASRGSAAPGRNGHETATGLGRDLHAIETEMRAEAGRLDALAARARTETGFGGRSADASLLESTLDNYRERAGRLRDDLEGIRRRLDSLSSSEIAGFLEELGDDLAELQK